MWEWSHTEDAYTYAREKLSRVPRDELIQIAEDWNGYFSAHEDLDVVSLALDHVHDLTAEVLADWIWGQASCYEHGRKCTNGGHELYLDPHGNYTVDLSDIPDNWQPSE